MQHRKSIRYTPMLDQLAVLKPTYVDHCNADRLARARVGPRASAPSPDLVSVIDDVLDRQGQSLHIPSRGLDLIFQYLGTSYVGLGKVFVLGQFCGTNLVGNG